VFDFLAFQALEQRVAAPPTWKKVAEPNASGLSNSWSVHCLCGEGQMVLSDYDSLVAQCSYCPRIYRLVQYVEVSDPGV
jgi:hypothetical protein